MLRIHTVLITLLITALAACGTNPGSTGTGSDAGTEDGRSGHGETGLDASADVAMDDGSDAPADTATDAPADTPSDAGGDAPIDMGSDALIDTGGDAPIDTGGDAPGDAGGDAPIDTGGDAPGDTGPPVEGLTYAIVDTGQDRCFGLEVEEACEGLIDARFGQDAQYHGNPFDLVDNGDGTLTDHVTGLMWQQDPGAKMTWDEAAAAAASFRLGGYDDWRLPTIEELYSLIDFNGRDPSGYEGSSTDGMRPFISDLFVFAYGDTGAGERLIDAQFATTTFYVGGGLDDDMMFGVNFADGRIKGYGTGPLPGRPGDKEFFVLYVRGDAYGINDFADNGDGTITDAASGLMWQRGDSVDGLDWPEALGWCEDLELAGHDDWRLPNVKELHSLVDYTRSPSTTSSAAIDPMFEATGITNEGGAADFAAYWSSTTHVSWRDGHEGASGAYVNFGRSMGYMDGAWRDVHGAGAQRGDPKTGDPADWPTGHGPQGDAIRIYNHVRCVRLGATFESVVPAAACGDSYCDAVEADSCPADCGGGGDEPICGDDICGAGEDTSCPDDCGSGGELPTCDEVEPGRPCCGDDVCGGPETIDNCAIDCDDDGGGDGPVACTEETDCDEPGACPDGASMGCTCAPTPGDGRLCLAVCVTDDDCPTPPDITLRCGPGSFCVPAE